MRGIRGSLRLSEGRHGKDVSTPDTCRGEGEGASGKSTAVGRQTRERCKYT